MTGKGGADPFDDVADALYVYRSTVTSVYDGDTCTVTLDAGWSWMWTGQKIRLWGINAPEVRGPERPKGLKSRDYLRGLILGKDVLIRSYLDRKGRYGRALGCVFVPIDGEWVNVNALMVRRRYAKRNTYGDKFDGWPDLGLD